MNFLRSKPVRIAAASFATTVILGVSAPAAMANTHVSAPSAMTEISGLTPLGGPGFPSQAEPAFLTQSRFIGQQAAAAQQQAAEAAAAAQVAAQWQVPVHDYQLTARFGAKGGWSRGYHTGLDFAGPVGETVMAAKAGTVIEAGREGAYGNTIVIDHGDGYQTRYAHLSSVSVSVGEVVAAGQPIGALGNTGRSTGPHLHFEIMQGKDNFLDPQSVMSIPEAM